MRGREVSRVEGFSDAVFGFTLTLLVVSVEVPDDFADLRAILEGFPVFAATFASICWVWYEHYLFFRRYPLEDGVIVVLNTVLLFVVMFYAYPLKFMFTRLIGGEMLGVGRGITDGMQFRDAQLLMVSYSAGFVALFGVFALLHWHVLRRRALLQLDQLAVYDANTSRNRHLINVAVGVTSIVLALALPQAMLALSGMLYFVLGPLHGWYGFSAGRRRERLMVARA